MKTLAVRYWLIIALAVYFLASISPFVFTGTVICSNEQPANTIVGLSNEISANVARWSDPLWQKEFSAHLPLDTSLVLLQNNQEVFRYGTPPRDPTAAGRVQLVIMDGMEQRGLANVYNIDPCGGQIYFTLALPASIIVQVLSGVIIALLLRRYVWIPLSAMSTAARQIAAGNLDFQIPPSRVREVSVVATAFHAMGDALRDSLTRQAELEQDRRFFVAAIAHDLRTPLFALRGYLEGLQRGLADTPAKTAHYIAVCQDKAATLEHLIADLFTFARLEYLEQTPVRAHIDFGKLIDKTVEDIGLRAEARAISLQVSGPPEPCSVDADWSLLTRAIGNLLDNALRYTPDGGWIKITWRKENHTVSLTVADSGPGIDPHDLPHIFSPLYRSETSRNRETGGAGLGLTIARRIFRAHGGDLVVVNQPGNGAAFTGTFPERESAKS